MSDLWSLLADSFWQILLPGLTMTIPLTVISFSLAMVIAVTVALIQFAKIPALKELCRFYIWVIRGTPLLVQLADAPDTPSPPARETPAPAPSPGASAPGAEVTQGTETYRGFQIDNVLRAPEGDIHYHIYVPDSYDGSEAYSLFLTLPGYEGLYFQGVGQNLYQEDFAFQALNYGDRMIVAAPQPGDWGDTSAEQAIALTEYLLARYNIDRERVYAEGYSGGGNLFARDPEIMGRLFGQ